MFEWLKDKTIGRIERWVARQFMRAIGEVYQKRLRERVKDIPKELKAYHSTEMLMNNNVTALHNLYKDSRDKNRFQEAFLYFFYEFEINLKHIIMSEMMIININKVIEEKRDDFFPVYSRDEINKIQKIGHIFELINKFCSIYGAEGKKIESALRDINKERNFIIHNMLKEEMNEKQIKKSFEQFFVKAKPHIKNSYGFFIKTFDNRPQNFLVLLDKLSAQKPKTETG